MPLELAPTEIVTPPVRLAFPALFEPKPVAKGSTELKFMATLLIPPTVELKPFYECVKAAMLDKWAKLLQLPAKNNPIKRCDEKELDGYEPGWFFINTKTQYQPNVVDQRRQEIIDKDRIFAGCWCRFHLNAYGYDHPQGGKGVSFGLNSVQLVREDARLDGRKTATDVFDEIETAGDDAPPPQKGGDVDELFGGS